MFTMSIKNIKLFFTIWGEVARQISKEHICTNFSLNKASFIEKKHLSRYICVN